MSSMLDQAILDAQSLREAALKNAESAVVEKYSDEVRERVEKLLEQEDKVLPEAYVSLLYNFMVEDGLRVVLHEAKHFICLGTPEDYEQYIFWWNYFQNY